MPKTAVDKYDFSPAWHHDIRRSGQILPVKTVPAAKRMQELPDDKFWAGVFGAHGFHDAGALFRRARIHHVGIAEFAGDGIIPLQSGECAAIPADDP